MPKEFTHQLLAELLIPRLRSGGMTATAELLTRNSWALFAGSLAPDALYYDIPDPTFVRQPRSALPLARQLHQADGAAIYAVPLALLQELRHLAKPPGEDLAFVLGFLSHLAADMGFHPVVSRFAAGHPADPAGEIAGHYRLESMLDVLLYNRFGKSLVRTNLRRSTRACSAASAGLHRFYARGLAAFCEWSEKELYYALSRAFCKQACINRLFQLPAFFKGSGWLSRLFPRRLSIYHALAHPPGPDSGPAWRWASYSWAWVDLEELVETSLLRAELLVRVALDYYQGRLIQSRAIEAFLRATPETGLRGEPA